MVKKSGMKERRERVVSKMRINKIKIKIKTKTKTKTKQNKEDERRTSYLACITKTAMIGFLLAVEVCFAVSCFSLFDFDIVSLSVD